MWKSQTNEGGHSLSQFERDALIERHCELFGTWPDLCHTRNEVHSGLHAAELGVTSIDRSHIRMEASLTNAKIVRPQPARGRV